MANPKTPHYHRVIEFMLRAGQACPLVPTVPDEKTRVLRARLMLEEVLETIAALGVEVTFNPDPGGSMFSDHTHDIKFEALKFEARGEVDMVEVADGCADVAVVTTGTLIALGIPDVELQEAVDVNNLAKFGPGGRRDDNGKWIKPPGHKPPNVRGLLEDFGYFKQEARVPDSVLHSRSFPEPG